MKHIMLILVMLLFSATAVSAQEILWEVELAEHGLVSPAESETMIFIGSHGGGHFFALDAETGEEVWSHHDLNEHVAPVIVQDGVVYLGSTAQIFYALDAATGEEIWQFDAEGGIWTAPLLVDDVLYFGTDTGTIFALNAGDGAEIWRTEIPDPIYSDMVYENGQIIVAAGRTLYLVNAEDGAILWEQSIGSRWSSPAVQNGMIYAGNEDGNFYALNVETGDRVWQFEGARGSIAWTVPLIYEGAVYAGNRSRGLYALDAETGELRWEIPSSTFAGVPIIANDVLYFGAGDLNRPSEPGIFYAADPESGEIFLELETTSAVLNRPVIDETRRLYLGTVGGSLVAVQIE